MCYVTDNDVAGDVLTLTMMWFIALLLVLTNSDKDVAGNFLTLTEQYGWECVTLPTTMWLGMC